MLLTTDPFMDLGRPEDPGRGVWATGWLLG